MTKAQKARIVIAVDAMMTAAGFDRWNTGGNVICWGREGLDGANYLMTHGDEKNDVDAPDGYGANDMLYGPVDQPIWGICRTSEEGFTDEDSDYQDAHCAHTLADALAEVQRDIDARWTALIATTVTF